VGFVVQPAAFAEQILEDLRRRIATWELAPGTHLVEGRLAAEYAVSRGPVREALKQLKVEGLVEARKRGIFVTGLTERDVAELTELRTAIETLAVRLLQVRATEREWAAMVAAVARMREAADVPDLEAFTVADIDFHTAIYVASGNRRLLDVWTTYSTSFATLLRLSKKTPDDLVDGVRSHERLIEVLRTAEAETAVATVREHLQGTRRLLAEVVRRPDRHHQEDGR